MKRKDLLKKIITFIFIFSFMLILTSVSMAEIKDPYLKKVEFSSEALQPISPDGFAIKLTLEKTEAYLEEKIKAVFEIKNISDKPKIYLSDGMFQQYLFIIKNIAIQEEYHSSPGIIIHTGPPIYTRVLAPNETFKKNYILSEDYGLNKPGIYEITYIWSLNDGSETEIRTGGFKDVPILMKKIKDIYPDIANYPKKIVTNTVTLKIKQKIGSNL